jgi:orotate phosphoribosyltransferase
MFIIGRRSIWRSYADFLECKIINHKRGITVCMQRDNLIKLLKECGAIKFGRFLLTSGAVSDYYVDIKKASTDPKVLKTIAGAMSEHTQGYDMLAGMELGAVPLVVALSLKTGIPYVIVRKEKREHGTEKQIEGGDVEGKNILVIEDVSTSGGSVVKTVQILRENHANVDKVVVVVDRESGAREKLGKIDVDLVPLISVSEFLEK